MVFKLRYPLISACFLILGCTINSPPPSLSATAITSPLQTPRGTTYPPSPLATSSPEPEGSQVNITGDWYAMPSNPSFDKISSCNTHTRYVLHIDQENGKVSAALKQVSYSGGPWFYPEKIEASYANDQLEMTGTADKGNGNVEVFKYRLTLDRVRHILSGTRSQDPIWLVRIVTSSVCPDPTPSVSWSP